MLRRARLHSVQCLSTYGRAQTIFRMQHTALAEKRVIVSGIQPTGVPHLGNYLGALKSWVELQNTAQPQDELYFFIVGLHALTVPQNPKTLFADRQNLMAALLAIGVDPLRCTLFQQDAVPEHAELMWYFACITSFGRLERMTTWKSKLATLHNGGNTDHVQASQLQLGLFAYPVLQAADILLYHPTHVPVGEDQAQHLELTRDIAEGFNRMVKKRYFPTPSTLHTPSKKILSLRNPAVKMSKSAPDANSRILLTDSPKNIQAKVRRAVTDADRFLSYDPEARPGVSNLINILSALDGGTLRRELGTTVLDTDPARLAETLHTATGGSGAKLKAILSESLIEALRPIQERYHDLLQDPTYLATIEKRGAERARERAHTTISQVRTMLGLQKETL
ncbi:tryptophan--tRNA ligase [Malassezia vespertilionis]|uniref:Tryptophan--tRNA ligase, mitochondrial n=1 Tax=Malassezia vespertilionis TaxID=2020962 RepID=A0A2N1JE38_9BASI|nr:tryptophan--tRNA ligase [Malassezia vespertilionis]PKI84817.1 Msw1p [Malassezia vespertilionis]WFD05635.1 tryptophan--tRNA ligase [Malassezia vespertilionis]